jgi:hypothetical protein
MASGLKLGFKFSIPGLRQFCGTSQLQNRALPPGQPGLSEIQVEGRADDIMAGWRGGGARSVSPQAGKLASLNRSWQSKEGTYRALGMAGIEPTPSKSECDWTPLSP